MPHAPRNADMTKHMKHMMCYMRSVLLSGKTTHTPTLDECPVFPCLQEVSPSTPTIPRVSWLCTWFCHVLPVSDLQSSQSSAAKWMASFPPPETAPPERPKDGSPCAAVDPDHTAKRPSRRTGPDGTRPDILGPASGV